MSATHIFLQLSSGPDKNSGTVEGGSIYAGYSKWIQIESVKWRVDQKNKTGGDESSSGEGDVTTWPRRVTLKKHLDHSSTRLYSMLNQNVKFAQAKICFADPKFVQSNELIKPVMSIALTDGYIEAINIGGSGTDFLELEETLQLSFASFTLSYQATDPKSGLRKNTAKFNGTRTFSADFSKPV